MTELERLTLLKSLASDRVASYARAIANALKTGDVISPTLTDMFIDAVEAHEKAREELMRGLCEQARHA